MGSERVSSQSSILLVCSRMASSGLGSLVASERWGPPNGDWFPRWYPAVPGPQIVSTAWPGGEGIVAS